MVKLITIGMGGFIGSVLRYLMSGAVQGLTRSISFPWGTFAVNLTGCFVIGFLSHLSETRGLFAESARAFVFLGLLGGFTTFSAFSNETITLLRDGETSLALVNIGGQVILCLGLVWLGRAVAYWIWR